MLWQILMSVNLILVTSMPTVRTPMEATNASAGVVTVVMDGYAMVISLLYCAISYYDLVFLMSDINECTTGLHNCSGILCHNFNGTFQCGTKPMIDVRKDPGILKTSSKIILL
jgi:hypothetical protein